MSREPTRHPPDDPAYTALLAARASVSRAVTDARRELDRLVDDNLRVRHELRRVMDAPSRQLAVRASQRLRRVMALVAHPIWSVRAAWHLVLARGAPSLLRAAGRRYLLTRAVFRHLPVAAQRADRADMAAAIRWVGDTRICGETRQALLTLPNASVTYRVHAAPGAWITTGCCLVPQVWPENHGGVDFAITASLPGASTSWSARCRVDPGRRWSDRRWRRLRVRLPLEARTPIDVTLEARLPADAADASAWAIWGEPELRSLRSRGDLARALGAFFGRIRSSGLGAALRGLRGTLGDAGHSAEAYRAWVERHDPSAADLQRQAGQVAALPRQPLVSVVTPVYNTDARCLRACIESVRQQAYPHWELCLCDDASTSSATRQVLEAYRDDPRIRITSLETNSQISMASNAALALASGELVALLDHDDELSPHALLEVVGALNAHPDTDLFYSDEDKLDQHGVRCDPAFKPDWSPDHFLACMYTCHLMVLRRSLLLEIGGFRRGYEGAQDYDLVLRVMERTDRIRHIPKVLYHWRKLAASAASTADAKPWALDAGRRALEDWVRRTGSHADVRPGAAPGLFRVRRHVLGQPLVSIVIPTRGLPPSGQPDLLAQAVRSIAQKTTYPHYELVVVADAGRVSDATRRLLSGVRHQLIPYDRGGPFNFSHKINHGVRAAAGAHVLLFNDDLEIITSDWLSAMLEYSQVPGVGAVGAKLRYPDGRLQHIGILIGVCGVAAHAFHQHPGSSTGYASSAVSPRNYSAVTAACMLTRREVFDHVGGFDEGLAVDFNDVDYCLRLRAAGYRIVFTPYAELYHHESASFGPRVQHPEELEVMRRRWGTRIDHDPYFNVNFSRDSPDYQLDLSAVSVA